jgi:hypothetical protein
MKEKDLKVDFNQQELILYAEKEDGSWGPIKTGSYLGKKYIGDYWKKFIKLEKSLVEEIKEGTCTTIRYYMTLLELNDAEMASRLGISRKKVRQHQTVKHFKEIPVKLLEKYAVVFGVPVANLFQALLIKDGSDYRSFFIKKKDPSILGVSQRETKNPYYVITQIEARNDE